MKEKIAAIIVCLFAAIPNVNFNLRIMANSKLWFYLVLVAGFFGFLFLYTKAHWLLKAVVIYCFVMGTYKFLFPVWGKDVAFGITDEWRREGLKGNWLCWPQAHNCPLQILFEIGFLGLAIMASFIGFIGYRLYKLKKTTLLSGLVILLTIMCFHFPTRMIQTVPMIILFLAICQKEAEIVN